MAFLPDKVWQRHANPWSGWTRVLTMPLLAAGLYYQNMWILGAAILWLIVNPWIFPKPERTDNWMSKGVLGEQRYFSDGKKFRKDLPTLLNLANVPVFCLFLYFGWQGQAWPMLLAAALSMTLKFWFIDRMARLEDEARSSGQKT